METSLSALTYEGSIPEAILESKRQKKLFVVYISGQDSDSVELEKSTWNDSKVSDSVSKYCILLHIPEGSTDATNFSAIYPQKSVPSIAAIGYNGVQLWQSEGFVSAEALASSLEKAWLSLHMQETTATVLTAALASKKLEQSNSGSSDIGSSRQESSSGAVVPTASAVKHVEFADVRTPVTSETIGDDNCHGQNDEDESTKYDDRTISNSLIGKSSSVEAEQSSSPTKENKEIYSPQILDPDNSVVDGVSSSIGDRSLTQEKIINQNSGFPGGDSQLVTSETNKASPDERDECMGNRKSDPIDDNERLKSLSDVHLNIRLPSGVSLQEKFSVTSSLRMVKDYVDRNQASGIGSYDLAIPYPRKVFSNEDLSKSLSELGLYNRQALIVVPHQRTMSYPRGDSSSDKTRTSYSDSSIENNGGYFASIKRMLSYFNPLSYLGGSSSSSSSGQDQTGIWEYSPNSAIQNNSASSGRPYSSNSPNQNFSSPGRSDSRSRQPTTSRYGSNIHTLKHDEDDSRFSDKNPFWNGNSTQYGGSSDGK